MGKKEDDLWHGIALDHELTAGQKGDEITLNCSEEEFESFWKDYFDLSEDYRSIKKRLLGNEPRIKGGFILCPGYTHFKAGSLGGHVFLYNLSGIIIFHALRE